ncbi:MAG: RNA polymerase sigma factor [Thermoanaerobaculales bacterium]|jgi:RNA polymerase sigma-70 factor (ECF subfamily)|nr:RNA polymerase sigma factor [Thermoanaerobaculales bacterium]
MSKRSGFFTTVDEHQLARARRGDRRALEELYRIFATPVHNLAFRLCGRRDEAEELLQETFLEVVRSIGSFRGDAPVGAWIRRVAVSKVLSRRRRADVRRIEVELDGRADAESLCVGGDRPGAASGARIDLERALNQLPETSRIVLWMHDVEGLTHAEIGELLGRTASFSKSRLARSHAALRHILNEAWSHEDASDRRRVAGAARR